MMLFGLQNDKNIIENGHTCITKQHHKNVPTFFWGSGTNATNFAMLKTDLFATFSNITIGYIKGPVTVQDFRIEN